MTAKLTVIIPCKNERENIAACVVCARQVADEVLVADSGSTDGTLELARELGCRIIEREYGTSGDFKNWAIPQATHEWVFILDADERISAALAAEIRAVLTGPQHDGYWVHRLNYFMGHAIRHGMWKNDRCLRLFRRDEGRYVGPTDHAEVEVSTGNVGRLRTRLDHYTCDSYSQYLPKVSRYADVQARLWQQRGKRASITQLLFRFPLRFLQGYVWRLGFLDGLAGVQVCALVAYQSWLKQAYLWQLTSGRDWRAAERAQYPHIALTQSPVAKHRTLTAEAPATRIPATNMNEPTQSESAPPQDRKRSFREFRRSITPNRWTSAARRQRRNMLFRRLGIQRCYTPPVITRQPDLAVRSCLPYVVAHELIDNPQLTFLQIGAYDGVGEDDMRSLILSHNLRGVLLEPQPLAFEGLQKTYDGVPNVTLLQAAIDKTEGTRNLYCKRGEANMAASFDREHLLKHGVRAEEVESQEVVCHTVESALQTAGLTRVDLIQIDAEGYDWPIIQSIDLNKLRPRIIRFEYRIMPPADADACLEHLAAHGYRFVVETRDIIAHLIADQPAEGVLPMRRTA